MMIRYIGWNKWKSNYYIKINFKGWKFNLFYGYTTTCEGGPLVTNVKRVFSGVCSPTGVISTNNSKYRKFLLILLLLLIEI